AEALGTTDLNGGALFNAEFGIRHRGSTVPERSGVALSFCRRPGTKHSRAIKLKLSATEKIFRNLSSGRNPLRNFSRDLPLIVP
ncbi:hypothetical protein LD001_18920, partial [Pseudomonas kurunegalensis]|uniref:hypothetical protein n=1 Tax=Pseudomonas kurunegalensis TaxID=485880 RepID=UPI001CDD5864